MNNLSDKNNSFRDETLSPVSSGKDILVYSDVLKDKDLFYIYKKVRRLSAVVFRLAGMMLNNQTMGDKLKHASLDLISLSTVLSGGRGDGGVTSISKIESLILEIQSFLEVASFSNLVSPMNMAILEREFDELLKRIAKVGSRGASGNLNLESYLTNPNEISLSEGKVLFPARSEGSSRVEDIKDNKYDLYKSENVESSKSADEKGKLRDFSSVAVKKNRRQSLVISLLKKKKEIMIKDLSGIINDCSEKTIQRELLALVASGILKKTGERRWTKYSLAN